MMTTPSRDILFLLRHDFLDGDATRYYCPECTEINGVLHYYPTLRHHLEIRYVDFQRPRPEIVTLLGEANQSCPVLLLGNPEGMPGVATRVSADGRRRFIAGARDIGRYLALAYGTGTPH